LELPRGIPSRDTFARVFERIDPREFQNSFKLWIASTTERTAGQVIAIDGKTLRRSHDQASDKKAIHTISAWATANQLVPGQLKTDDKSNEITAIPYLLKVLDISGCVITIDAMGAQKKTARTILDRGGDYVLALKENQKNLYDGCVLFFDAMKTLPPAEFTVESHQTVDGGHGRIETRACFTTSAFTGLRTRTNGPD
jgi:predicted transposase YbfD/YdcC